MKRVLTAAVLVPVVLLILFKAPNSLYSGFIGLIAVLAVHEYFGIAFRYQQKLHAYVIEVAIGLYFLGQCLYGINAFGVENFGRAFDRWATGATGVRVLPLGAGGSWDVSVANERCFAGSGILIFRIHLCGLYLGSDLHA